MRSSEPAPRVTELASCRGTAQVARFGGEGEASGEARDIFPGRKDSERPSPPRCESISRPYCSTDCEDCFSGSWLRGPCCRRRRRWSIPAQCRAKECGPTSQTCCRKRAGPFPSPGSSCSIPWGTCGSTTSSSTARRSIMVRIGSPACGELGRPHQYDPIA